MLKTTKVSYEIIHVEDNEVLVDGLSFDDMAEQFAVYQEFYGMDAVVPAARNIITQQRIVTNREAYTSVWVDYFEELLLMGNLN